ncbi:hypothetical protein PG984_005324 [Apiospora sp. TS-2023a]
MNPFGQAKMPEDDPERAIPARSTVFGYDSEDETLPSIPGDGIQHHTHHSNASLEAVPLGNQQQQLMHPLSQASQTATHGIVSSTSSSAAPAGSNNNGNDSMVSKMEKDTALGFMGAHEDGLSEGLPPGLEEMLHERFSTLENKLEKQFRDLGYAPPVAVEGEKGMGQKNDGTIDVPMTAPGDPKVPKGPFDDRPTKVKINRYIPPKNHANTNMAEVAFLDYTGVPEGDGDGLEKKHRYRDLLYN